ncbi:MAG: 30S ribosomal protein S13 [Nanoarchaeota archaeon]|nr:30S ribosomal protein S13 [Nanoarchaeota archaeon]
MVELRGLVRMGNADIEGKTSLVMGLTRIYGVDHMFAAAMCTVLHMDRSQKIGLLSDEQVQKIELFLKNPSGIPEWLLNRRNDLYTGNSHHVYGTDLRFFTDNDVKMMKKIKSYKGMRHAAGLPTRGQSTKAHFRHGKTVGVTKKAKAGKKS